jgi:TolB-like protein
VFGVLIALGLAFAGPRVAVLDLANHTGDASLDGAGAGLSGVLVSKLVLVEGVEVVERERLAAVLGELALARDGVLDPATAVRAGKLLGATHMVSGDLVSARPPSLSLSLRVVEVETGRVLAASEVRGEVGERGEEFFVLVDEATAGLIDALAVKLAARDRIAVGQVAVKGLDAVTAYGRAVTALDRGDRAAAEAALQQALALEPGFRLAEGALARVSAEVASAREGYANAAVTEARAQLAALEAKVAGTLPPNPTPQDLARAAVRARVRLARGDLAGAVAIEAERAAATTDAHCRGSAFSQALRDLGGAGWLDRVLANIPVWPWEVRMENARHLLALGRRDEAWTLALDTFQHPGPTFSVSSAPRNTTDWAARNGFPNLAVVGTRQALVAAQRLGHHEAAQGLLRKVDEAWPRPARPGRPTPPGTASSPASRRPARPTPGSWTKRNARSAWPPTTGRSCSPGTPHSTRGFTRASTRTCNATGSSATSPVVGARSPGRSGTNPGSPSNSLGSCSTSTPPFRRGTRRRPCGG